MKKFLKLVVLLLRRIIYPFDSQIDIMPHIIYGGWAVGLLAYFGVIENVSGNYLWGIVIMVLLLGFIRGLFLRDKS
jgi:hypothetical protein